MRVIFFVFGLLITQTIFAVCPFCTFAVGAGIGLTQYFGIDDTVTGLWIGGFVVSLIILTNDWFKKKKLTFYGYKCIVAVAYYAFTIMPLYLNSIIGHVLNKLWGIDRLLLGIVIGSVIFFIGAISYNFLKKHNNNHAYFPFQKVIMPIAPLIILSIIFYFITR